jgi:dTDP-4-dehydrorhamnose reductase
MGDAEGLSKIFDETHPEATFFCAGWSWVDGCEGDPQRAQAENGEQPGRAARCARNIGSHFTYFSSSYVFDGREGPYPEEARPRPISVYGQSKRAGEESVLEATQGHAVVARTMGVYGPEPQRKNFVFQVRQALDSGVKLRVARDQFGNITFAPDLARMALHLAQHSQSGIWNLAGSDPHIRRSDFALQIAASYGLPARLIEPVDTSALNQRARRPSQAGLLVEKVRRFTAIEPRDWVKIA